MEAWPVQSLPSSDSGYPGVSMERHENGKDHAMYWNGDEYPTVDQLTGVEERPLIELIVVRRTRGRAMLRIESEGHHFQSYKPSHIHP